jgi:hypothetical protein
MQGIGVQVLGAVYLTNGSKEYGERPNSERYTRVRPSANVVDEGLKNIFICTALGEDGQGYDGN